MNSAAVRLLIERALNGRTGLDLRGQADGIIRLCAHVGGLPLGLEIVAGLLNVMPASELADRVRREPGVMELTTTRGHPARHARLRNLLDTAWLERTEQQRRTLIALAVFEGGFRSSAALTLAAVPEGHLEELVDASWLYVSNVGRYDFHPYIHAFLRECGGRYEDQTVATVAAYVDLCLATVRSAGPHLHGPELPEALALLDEEHPNLLAAWDYAALNAPISALELAERLTPYWLLRNYLTEGLDRLQRALEASRHLLDRGDPLRTGALLQVGQLALRLSRWRAAQEAFEQAQLGAEGGRRPAQLAEAHHGLGLVAYYAADLPAARTRFLASQRYAETANDTLGRSDAVRRLALIDMQSGDYVSAKELNKRALRLAEVGNDPARIAGMCLNLATSLGYLGESEEGISLNERALHISQTLGDLQGQGAALVNLGFAAGERGERDERERCYYRSLELFRQLGDDQGAVHLLNNLAAGKQYSGEPLEAQVLLEECLEILKGTEDVQQRTRALQLYGNVLLDLGDRAGAWERIAESVALCREHGEGRNLAWALITLARWHGEADEFDPALSAAGEALALSAVNSGGRQLRRAREALEGLEARAGAAAMSAQGRDSWPRQHEN